MSPTRLACVLSLVIIVVGVMYAGSRRTVHPPSPVRAILPPQETGSGDDPHARAAYEWMRLRSPRTGVIPRGIREKELVFASRLPEKGTSFQKSGAAAATKVYDWVQRGPWNVGGRTRALALDVSDPTGETILAGGVSGGMWKTTNGGITWTMTTKPHHLHSVSSIAQDTRPGKTNVWYYGTGELIGNSANGKGAFYVGNGIFKSTNGGDSWSQLSDTSPLEEYRFDSVFDIVWNVAVDASNLVDDEIYAAVYGQILRSTDGGKSWHFSLGDVQELEFARFTDIATASDGVVYATLSSDANDNTNDAADKGIWRSADGVDWINITPDSFPGTYQRVVIGISPSDENIVYFLGYTPDGGQNDHSLWKYTYVSGDGSGNGSLWVDRSPQLPADGGKTGDFVSQGGYDLVVAVHPDDPDIVYLGGIALYRSTDGFRTSSHTMRIGGYADSDGFTSYLNHHPDIHAIVFYDSNHDLMLTGTDGGVAKTIDNRASTVSWIPLNNGYFTTQFYTIALDPTPGSTIIIGGMQDNGTQFVNSPLFAEPWVDIFGGDGGYAAISRGAEHYYVSAQQGLTYRLNLDTNGDENGFTRVDMGGDGFLFVNPFILDPNDNNVMFMARGSELWRNDDLDGIPPSSNDSTLVNWTKIADVEGKSISALAVSTTPPNTLYFGTVDGKLYRLANADQANQSISNRTGQDFPDSSFVSSVSVDPGNGNNILVTFSNYEVRSVFYSTSGGFTWTDVSGNLEEFPDGSGDGPSVRWGAILTGGSSPEYFVGTSTGLYSTTELDGGNTTWMQEGTNEIGNVVVDMIDVRPADGTIVAGTHGNGVYSTSTLTTVETKTASPPERFALRQNYPNPFNPVTTISFHVPSPEEVTLSVFNTRGQKVRTLIRDKMHAPGDYTIVFDGRNDAGVPLATGIYFYAVKTTRFTATKKMLLVK